MSDERADVDEVEYLARTLHHVYCDTHGAPAIQHRFESLAAFRNIATRLLGGTVTRGTPTSDRPSPPHEDVTHESE